MSTTLPKKTPQVVREWVRNVEQYHPVGALATLGDNASLQEIREAYEADKATITGIGEALLTAAQWNAWPDSDDHD